MAALFSQFKYKILSLLVSSLKVRLFQRKSGFEFEGRIHEMVDASILRAGGHLAVLPLIVHHYGEDDNSHKINYYLRMSQQKVAEKPGNAKAYFELGIL